MLRSRAADERTVEMEAKRSPGVPVKISMVSTTNSGLERHPGDIPDNDLQHQQVFFADANGPHTGRQAQLEFAARTKTKNTYFHRVAQHGQAVDGRKKTVASASPHTPSFDAFFPPAKGSQQQQSHLSLENMLLQNKLAKIQQEVAALNKQVADKEEGCLRATQEVEDEVEGEKEALASKAPSLLLSPGSGADEEQLHRHTRTSRAAIERTVEKQTQRSPGVPIKLIVASTITNPGLERHPDDDILDEDRHQQQDVFAAATGHRVHLQSGARTKTSNTYFHRVAQHGQAVDRRTKTVGSQQQQSLLSLESKMLEKKFAKLQQEVAALKKQVSDKEEARLHATQEPEYEEEGEKGAPSSEVPSLSPSGRANEEPLLLELQAKFSARAKELGISQVAVEAALSQADLGIKPQSGSPGAIRILQWNILADGLAKDGFLVRDVLSGASEDGEITFEKVVNELAMARASGAEDLSAVKAEFSSDRSKKNLDAVVDWRLRFLMIQKYVLAAKADIIVLQEVDHMLEMQEVFGLMGYTCARDGKAYIPAHAVMEEQGVKRDPAAFFKYLKNADVAFVPKTNSNCRKFGLKDREDADDDGVAIFWRRDTLELVDLEFLVFDDPKRNQGAVRAMLKRVEDNTKVAVIAAHLSSGSGSKDEEARLKECKAPSLDAKGKENGPSMCEWINSSAKMAPTVMCFDANSAPESEHIPYKGRKLNVWEALCSIRPSIRSVWAPFYGPDGVPSLRTLPVTTNKMRGPLSAQAKKIGEHAIGLVDQTFFTSEISFLQHAYPPATFSWEGDARGQLLPTLKVPSDHYPVITDLQLPIGLGTAWAKKTQTDHDKTTQAETTNTQQTSLGYALLLKRKQLASEKRLIKLVYVEWETTVMSMSKFHDDMDSCAHGTLTTVQGERIGELLPAPPAALLVDTDVSPQGMASSKDKEKEEEGEEEEEEFKFGDRVRVRESLGKPRTGWGRVSHGEVGMVTRVSGTNIKIDFPSHKDWSGHVDDLENVDSLEKQRIIKAKAAKAVELLIIKSRFQFSDAGAWLLAEDAVQVPGSDKEAVDVELRLHFSSPLHVHGGASNSTTSVAVFLRCEVPKPEDKDAWKRIEAYAGCAPGMRLVVPYVLADNGHPVESRFGTVMQLSDSADDGFIFQVDNNAKKTELLDLRPAMQIRIAPPAHTHSEGQRLLVVLDNTIRDAELCALPLDSSHEQSGGRNTTRLQLVGDGSMVDFDLNPFNHCAGRLNADTTEAVRIQFCANILVDGEFVEDGITGRRLRIKDQLIHIRTTAGENATGTGMSGVQLTEWTSATTMGSIADILLKPSLLRLHGTHEAEGVLIRASPGTGKSWSMLQLHYLLAKDLAGTTYPHNSGVRLVPFLVVVQQLVQMLVAKLQSSDAKFPSSSSKDLDNNMLVDYINWSYSDKPEERNMLLQAYDMRTLIVLLDGIDEAAGFKERIEDFLVNELVPMGMRTIATSRPEGVRLQLYQKSFVIMNLEKLNDKQQRSMILAQLNDDEHFTRLSGFSQLRKDHDGIYNKLFSEQQARAEIEDYTVQDRFYLKDGCGAYDAAMRQHVRGGVRVVAPISEGAPLQSGTLRVFDKLLRQDRFLQKLNENLNAVPTIKKIQSVASRLARLMTKRNREEEIPSSPEALWKQILARTDEIYVVADEMREVFSVVAKQLVHDSGLEADALHIGPLKDPVRVHEKAVDDYADRFPGEHPEACVADIIRSKVVCTTSSQMLQIIGILKEGFVTQYYGKEARLELIRCKNKFQPLAPTHFRNMLCNIRLTYEGSSFFMEIQVHMMAIYELQESNPNAHPDYEYFRSKMGDNEQDTMLERTMLFFEEASGVPVLLSMLVLVFGDSDDSGNTRMPSSLEQLYTMAVDAALRTRIRGTHDADLEPARLALRHVAVSNQLTKRRVFHSSEVQAWLASRSGELGLWRRLEAEGAGVPLVKTLQAGGQYGAEYQFKHLSFQEALFAGELIAGKVPEFWAAGVSVCAKDAFNANALRIMGSSDNLSMHLRNLKADTNIVDTAKDCSKALFEVAEKGHAEGLHETGWRLEGWRLADVVMLLAGGVDVEDPNGRSPLHKAAEEGHTAVIEALLAAGAAVNLQDMHGWSPLYMAAYVGCAAVVVALLAAGAAVDLQNNDGKSPLWIAAIEEETAAIEALLAGGAAVDLQDKTGRTPLDVAKREDVKALLRARGGHVEAEITQ